MTEKNHFDGRNYANYFNAHRHILPNAELAWLNDVRAKAISSFIEVGLPGPKVEEWKYTNLNLLKTTIYETSEKIATENTDIIQKYALEGVLGSKVVFVDGYFNSELSDVQKQQGVVLTSLNEFISANPEHAEQVFQESKNQDSLGELNTALMTGGFVLIIDENIKLAEPIQIFHIASEKSQAKSLRLKNFINIKSTSSAQIIEYFISPDNIDCWRQNVTEVIVGEKAKLEIYQFQQEGNETIHMNQTLADVKESGNFKHYSLNIGGKISRTEIKPTINGLYGNVDLRGAFLGRNGNSHDVFTHMKHMKPEGDSNQSYRGVLDKGGKSAFQGKVYVAKDAQLTNANQSNKNLLLDRGAEANSKPELLIYADDVKCSHGTTVGELDNEAIFYLKSRGLDQKAAKALLVEAFVAEVFEDIKLQSVKSRYLELAGSWLESGD
ncbi:MAG: Fe-S cluster assembly protein SufD [Emcibacteraceae bacterium]|nr:Fe-S cluster assembly protein SufD [Emcibacteraceae bacterium]